ncbi:hypothetical protein N1M2_30 [Klebsiella phage N1M2]|uniref:Uncharacterized protein n=1 Tax=Klebsiella phage N1M2 TaxID=2664939 RepID=A0A6B7ZEF9_9CAUD|nr:hypothetical protein PQB72_gp030 [Klebsiella phage N1M2]QGH71893.1 hypothetical protein N1M2_30 [Klebsiella phage N1M2]
MARMLSVNIYPLLRIVKRYDLDQDLFFRIILNFLSHRREEILNIQLSKWFSSFDVSLKSEMKPIIYELLSELDYSDNVEDYFILNGRFYIKENTNVTESE